MITGIKQYNRSDQFEQVTIIKKVNIYFDEKITSRTVFLADDSRKTLRFMMLGESEFGTGASEVMEMLKGKMNVAGLEWLTYIQGGFIF